MSEASAGQSGNILPSVPPGIWAPQGALSESALSEEQLYRSVCDIHVEQTFLGALLMSSGLAAEIPQGFTEDCLSVSDYQAIYRAINRVDPLKERRSILLEVMNEMGADKDLRLHLSQLIVVPTTTKPGIVMRQGALLMRLRRYRTLLEGSQHIRDCIMARGAEDGSNTPEAISARVVTLLDDVTAQADTRTTSFSAAQAASEVIRRAKRVIAGEAPAGLSTGFSSIDRIVRRLHDGTVTILGARPSVGKSALGFAIAKKVAEQGHPVAIFSLEMSHTQIMTRMIADHGNVPIAAFDGGLTFRQEADAEWAQGEISLLPLVIEEAGGWTVAQIAARARAIQREHGLRLIVIDHVNIIQPEKDDLKGGPTWAVGRVSGGVKRLAQAMNCPVLLLSQLSRAVEGRDDKRPTLSDLRQAGDLEQDADNVGMLYRDDYYLPKEPPAQKPNETPEKHQIRVQEYHEAKRMTAGKAEVIFVKVRDGEQATAHLNFYGPTASFTEIRS